MHRILRAFLPFALAIAVLVGARPAWASPPASDGAGAGVAAGEAVEHPITPSSGAETPILPRDVPIVVSAAHAVVPPPPAGYVTKDLGWLVLSYPPEAEERVASIVRDADAIKGELGAAFEQPVLDHVEVRVAPTTAHMARLAPLNAPPPGYASGVAYPRLRLVLLSMMQPRGAEAVDLDEVFRHELVHVALDDATRGQHVPVWFNEGLAIYLSGEHGIDRTRVLSMATLSGSLLPFADLDRSFPADDFEVNIAYAESADFVRFLERRSDQLRFTSMIERVRDGQPFDRAMNDAYASDLRKLEFEWRDDVGRRFSLIPILTGGGFIWTLVVGALVWAYVKRRRRTKRILARWAREEAVEDGARARAAALAVAAGDTALVPVSIHAKPAVFVVEHDGNLHTLH